MSTTKAPPAAKDFEVSSILRHREQMGKTEYEVSWVGYDAKDTTWEPADNLNNCSQLLRLYNDAVNFKKPSTGKAAKYTALKSPSAAGPPAAALSDADVSAVVGVTVDGGVLKFVLRLKGRTGETLVSEEEALERFPRSICRLLLSKLQLGP